MTQSIDTVVADDSGIHCVRADGTVDAVSWSDLRLVGVETNDAGPFIEDVYFYLEGPVFAFYIPQRAEGTDELTRRFAALPGFDNRAFAAAMCSTGNEKFVCWRASADRERSAGM
jgi:hypothetical protein